MKKFVFMLLAATMLCSSNLFAQFSGSGTVSDPYLISSDQDLKNLADEVVAGNTFSGKYFMQTADIDLVDSQVFPEGFTPIGGFDGSKPFSGTYDGGGHSILKMKITGHQNVGMFSLLNNGCIKNLNLENVNFTADYCATKMGLVASSENSQILNVTISGQIAAADSATYVKLSAFSAEAYRTTISGCVSMLTFDVGMSSNPTVAGIAIGTEENSRNVVSNCLVSTFIREGNLEYGLDNEYYTEYYPIVYGGTATKCLVAESNANLNDANSAVTYTKCYFDHQNTRIAEFPVQQFFIDGFVAKSTSALTSGSLFNDANWIETAGLYPRPAAVANTNAAILTASPMTLNSSECMAYVQSDFTVSTANNVTWASESSFLQVSGGNVTLHSTSADTIAEIYAYRNNLVKNLQITLLGGPLGTKGNPYRISSEEDLFALANMFDSYDGMHKGASDFDFDVNYYGDLYFLVDADITITADSLWVPIGNYQQPFRWYFDGGNHTIDFGEGYLNYSGENYNIGFFGSTNGAHISNLTVKYNHTLTCSGFGGIVETAYYSVISNCKVMGYIEASPWEGYGDVGCIVGTAYSSIISNCVNYASVGGYGLGVGGIVGYSESSDIRSCANLGFFSVSLQDNYAGGIVGSTYIDPESGDGTPTYITGCANYGCSYGISGGGVLPVGKSIEDSNSGAIVGSADAAVISDCANYGHEMFSLAATSNGSTFKNNVSVPGNAGTIPYDTEFSILIMPSPKANGNDGNSYNTCSNNFTDKQMIPLAGNSFGFEGLLTSDLTSGNVDLDADKWVFNNGRYPMPIGTDLDNDLVKLETTPIFLASDDDVKSVSSSFELPSSNGISWMLDSVPLSVSTIDLDSLQQDSTRVYKTLHSIIGDEYCIYNIVIPARVGTADNPLLIESIGDFNAFAQAIADTTITYKGMTLSDGGNGLHFKLTADISGNISQVSGFSGNFNGGGHTITISPEYLVVNSNCGLFLSISFATIDSLNVVVNGAVSQQISSTSSIKYISILCTEARNSTISNCSVTLNSTFGITGGSNMHCGLVCGLLQNSTLEGCSALGSGTVTQTDATGGIVAYSQNSKISNCTNNLKIEPATHCNYSTTNAGIVAKAYSLILENCVNNADIINSYPDNDYSYISGIVGMLSEDGSYSTNIIRNSVNNGYIYGRGVTNSGFSAGEAGGILGGVSNAKAKIESCMNVGKVEAYSSAAGIAIGTNVSVSNCANYGSIESEENIAGIKYINSGNDSNADNGTSEGNVVACRVTNDYGTNYKQDVISQDADEDDFFDEQITEIRVDSLRLNFYDNGTSRTTQTMIGNALADELPGDWDFADGLYPLPAGLDPNDARNKLARLPIVLKSESVGRSERITALISNLTLPQVDGVTWESSSPDVVSVPSGGGVATVTNPSTDSDVTITATCDGISRSYTITVHKAQGTTADNPYIISSCSDLLYEMCDNRLYPAGGYGLFFKLGASFEINRSFADADGEFHVHQENLNVLFPENYPFRGTLDGDGYTITWANSGYSGSYYGLFKYTDGAEISNLQYYFNDNGFGSLIGNAKATTIRNCAVHNTCMVSDNVGGLVNISSDGTVIDGCIVTGNISSKHIGGVVAQAKDTRIANTVSMVSFNGEQGGDLLEESGAIVLSGINVEVDSCLVIGDNKLGVTYAVSPISGIDVRNSYYDKQVWVRSEADIYNNITGMTSRELLGDGIFNSARWTHAEGKYPVPAGTEDFAIAKLVSAPMLIGENDADVQHVTALEISAEAQEDEVEWSASGAVNSDLTVNCVDEPVSGEITSTFTDNDMAYSFTRQVEVTKGMLDVNVPENQDSVCEGNQITFSVDAGEATYLWTIEPQMDADAFDGSSITVTVPQDYIADRTDSIDVNLTLTVTFDGCEKDVNFSFTPLPSPSHIRVNDTAVCSGSDLMLMCYTDEGYENYMDNFNFRWYDANDMSTVLSSDSSYYIPVLNADRNLRLIVSSKVGGCIDTVDVVASVIESTAITVVSGEPNQQICEGEPMEPIVFSVANPNVSDLPYGVRTEYDTANSLLTLSGHPINSEFETYTISACGDNFTGTIDVSYRRSGFSVSESFSNIVTLGESVNISVFGSSPLENLLTWENLEGMETYTTEELGLSIQSRQEEEGVSSTIEGTPEMPGEYIFRITIPAYENCPAIICDNFLGVYDNSDLVVTSLDTTLCLGETTTLATVERPGAYGGEYVWIVGNDTVGTGSRMDVEPQQTITYNVMCGGKRMVGEFEVGDYVYPDEAFGETGYSMRKYFEYSPYSDYGTGYLITNIEEDSLLLMSLSKIDGVEWSQAAELLASDDEDLYLPPAGEYEYLLNNYVRFYSLFIENEIGPAILTSSEKDDNTVYAFNTEYGLMMEHPKTEPATAVSFKKIAKSEVINMVGRTSDISRTGSINIIVNERHSLDIRTAETLCNTDTARVAIATEYQLVNWYNISAPEQQIVVENDTAVLAEGSYMVVATDEYGSCSDTLELKVQNLAFDIPQDTVSCDTVSLTIEKEGVNLMLDGEIVAGQTITIAESGTYTIAVADLQDETCREEKQINVSIGESYSEVVYDTIYDGSYVWNDEILTSAGTYTFNGTTVLGCDSIVTLVLIDDSGLVYTVNGIVMGFDGTPLPNVIVTSVDTSFTTGSDGSYAMLLPRTKPLLSFSLAGYSIVNDSIMSDGEHDVVMLCPELEIETPDSTIETYPYVRNDINVVLSNDGDGPLTWSAIVESDVTNGRSAHRRMEQTEWNVADSVIYTHRNSEQAVATDGYYIYTASWTRAGEFSRYTLDGYVESFVVNGVGAVRNLAYGDGYFFATDNSSLIYKIDMDSQNLVEVIDVDYPIEIRYCAYSDEEGVLYVGNWNALYKLIDYESENRTLIQIANNLNNVYSIAYDNFSGDTPCLWAFSQISQGNGPFATIQKLNADGQQVGITHYVNEPELGVSPSSLAGGICASQYLYDNKFVLLANIQNSSSENKLAIYEIGSKGSWVSISSHSGVIPAGGSANILVSALATETGDYVADVKFKPLVFSTTPQNIQFTATVSAPECYPVQNLIAETDTFHTINLSWDDGADNGDNEELFYLLYEVGTDMPIDTVQTTSYSISNPEVGNHCYYVRTLVRGETDCVSEPSNTACAEIIAFPCDVQLTLTARAYGDRIRLEWNELFGVEQYVVHVDDLTGVVLYIGSETMFEDTIATLETNYCYKVVAYFRNDECEPKTSNSACARISAGGCSELPVVTAQAVGNSVAVTWTRVQGMQSYALYRDGRYLTSTSDTIFYDMSLEYETEYCYIVEIDCGYGNYGLSEAVCATTEAEENAVESIDSNSFELYPNPASDMFFIEGQLMQGIEIVNFAGQVVYETGNVSDDKILVDVSGFAPGVYAVRIILQDARSVVKRIVISR